MNQCVQCSKETTNPKFCSRSCSASYNNKLNPKRLPEGRCTRCGRPITSGYTYCKQCFAEAKRQIKYDIAMLGDFQCYTYQRNAKIRSAARRIYKRSSKSKVCAVCGYDKHYEVCHIKGINTFDDKTPISVVNSLDNLIALCPNHHWELDKGLIEVTRPGNDPGLPI